MALNKKHVDDRGINTTYHRVQHINFNNGKLFCILDSYISKEFREKEKPAYQNRFIFNVDIDEEENYGIRQLCYLKIKELPEWSDATDC